MYIRPCQSATASVKSKRQVAGLVTNCHGKQVTNNTIFGEFAARASEIVDSRAIVRIIPARQPADKDRAFSALQTSVQKAKEADG
jgi:hypothetical protein